jgi:ATP-dependent DNA helicase RecG
MSLPVNINTLINGNTVEWERIEFKKSWNDESILHTLCAFANDINNWNGGYLIVGIEENEGRPVLPPSGIGINQIDSIQKKCIEISKRIQPNYFPVIEPVVFQEKHIIVIWCPGGDYRPYTSPATLGEKSQRVHCIRRGSSTIKANVEEERMLLELTAKIPFDDRINHHSTIDDISLSLIYSYLKEIGSKLYDEALKMNLTELCKQMQIVKGSDEYSKPVNVGLLMFSENPQKYFPGAYIDIAIYKDNEGTEYTQKEFKGSLHSQLRLAMEFINTNVIKEIVRKQKGKAESLRFFNYPYDAIEESLANAVYHRSYEHPNQIEVHVRPDKIEIISYPGALPPIDNEALKNERIVARNYRNRRIGGFLKELHLTEAKGTGIPTIRKSMAINGSPLPIFEMDRDKTYFLTIIPIHPNYQPDNRKLKILDFCKNPKSRQEILVNLLKISNQTYNYKNTIIPLINDGLIKFTDTDNLNSRNQKYIITDKGIELLENETLTNNTN